MLILYDNKKLSLKMWRCSIDKSISGEEKIRGHMYKEKQRLYIKS